MEPDECCICSEEATVVDTEYDEGFCTIHAHEYQVFDGPHRVIGEDL